MSSGGPPHVERRAAAAATDDRVARISDALGAANLAGGLFQAYPAGGGTSQTAINDGAGPGPRWPSWSRPRWPSSP